MRQQLKALLAHLFTLNTCNTYMLIMPYYDANTIKLVKQRKEMLGLIRTINQYTDWTDDLMFPDKRPLTCPHLSVFPSCATSVLKNQLAVKIMNLLSSVSFLPLFYLIFHYKALLPDKKKKKNERKTISVSMLNHRIYMECCIVSRLDVKLQHVMSTAVSL